MTIGTAKNEIRKLENELELYLEKKKINFQKTQPSSPKLKEIVEGKSDTINPFDKFTHYVIRNEDLDKKIYAIQEEINALEKFIINEMKRISKAPLSEKIVYYRDEEFRSWNEITKLTHYSLRQCHNLYNQAKM